MSDAARKAVPYLSAKSLKSSFNSLLTAMERSLKPKSRAAVSRKRGEMRRIFSGAAMSRSILRHCSSPAVISFDEALKALLQSLVPSIMIAASSGWLAFNIAGNAARPFLPSHSLSSKAVVLPHKPSSIITASFPRAFCSNPVQRISSE